MILALDLGTRTGWAACHHGAISSGFVDFKNGRYEGGGMRYLRFRQWLDQMDQGNLLSIHFEEVRAHKGTDAAHVYGGLLATLTSWCEAKRIPYQGIPVGVIKKHATGKGNAGKPAMIAAAQRVIPTVKDDNEADAICLLDYVFDGALLTHGDIFK